MLRFDRLRRRLKTGAGAGRRRGRGRDRQRGARRPRPSRATARRVTGARRARPGCRSGRAAAYTAVMATRPKLTESSAGSGRRFATGPRARRAVLDDLGRADQAALHRGRPARGRRRRRSACRASIPYTRGVYPSMYRGRLWTMRQFAGFGTAEETNERFRYLLDHGQTGLSTAFDMPSLMGHDSDHPRSLGEVGREGVAVDTLDDMETLFAGIPLDEVTVSMTINAPGGDHARLLRRRGRAPGRSRPSSSAARSRPTSSRSTSPRRSGASRSTRRCGWSPT